jgi:hypothetical protein
LVQLRKFHNIALLDFIIHYFWSTIDPSLNLSDDCFGELHPMARPSVQCIGIPRVATIIDGHEFTFPPE